MDSLNLILLHLYKYLLHNITRSKLTLVDQNSCFFKLIENTLYKF